MKLLVATVPLTGHVQPMCLVVAELVARGHDVIWYAATKFGPRITATGARFVPMGPAIDWDDADVETALPALRGKRGLSRVKAQLRAMFIEPMVAQLRELEAIVDREQPVAILADQAHLGAALLAETRPLAWFGLGISALVIPSIDVAPFGSALPYLPGDPGRKRNKLLYWIIHQKLFGGITRLYREQRVAAGLPQGEGTYFDVFARDLYLQPTIESFEYPRTDLPAHVRFIGPLVPPPSSTDLPAWWPDIAAADRPIVLVTQGTLATNPRELLLPTLTALAAEPVLVVATIDPALVPDAPDNARLAPFIPYASLLPHVAVMITNGGYGGVQMALAAGVPLIVAGGSEEKPEIARRVAWTGAGLDLRTGRPRKRALRKAVRRVLAEPSFRESARRLATEMAAHDAPREAADAIERGLALSAAPS